MLSSLWPPQYKMRRSKRAKNVSLRIYCGRGLEVVIPDRKRSFDVLAFLNLHREWIEKQAKKFKIDLRIEDDQPILPSTLNLRVINKMIDIVYRPIASSVCVSSKYNKDKIIFYGAITDVSICTPTIVQWLKKQAKIILGDLLKKLSVQYHLPFRKLSIRAQKTVWGSCTAKKDIQLNYKILFLPESLAQYILVHELCHTAHLNHSISFWKMVVCIIPDYRAQIKSLKTADQFIPRWLS